MIYNKGELTVICGKTKSGKSTKAMDIAAKMLKNDMSVLYIDSEYNDETFNARFVSNLSGVKFETIYNSSYTKEEGSKVFESTIFIGEKFNDGYRFIHEYMPKLQWYTPGISGHLSVPLKNHISTLIEDNIFEHKISFVIIDFINNLEYLPLLKKLTLDNNIAIVCVIGPDNYNADRIDQIWDNLVMFNAKTNSFELVQSRRLYNE